MPRPLIVTAFAAALACNEPQPQAASAPSPPSATPPVASFPPPTAATGASSAPAAWRSLMVVRPPGWTVKEDPPEKDHAGVVSSAGTGTCSVRVDVWAGLPPSPGGPLVTQSKRSVTVDGHTLELVRTSVFEGAAAVVDALFANDGTSFARAVFRECTPAEVDQALASAKLAKGVRDPYVLRPTK